MAAGRRQLLGDSAGDPAARCLEEIILAYPGLEAIAIQRTAGLAVRSPAERVRMFSWLSVAPSLSNMVGPVLAGVLIDLGGFAVAFAAMLVLPLLTGWCMRWVPREPPRQRAATESAAPAGLALLGTPGLKRTASPRSRCCAPR